MSNQLPPSKFGAGTTYGESGQAYALPQPSPAPAPPPYPAADPYAANAHQAPPAPDTYPATPHSAPAPPQYSAAPQYSSSVSYSNPMPGTVMPMVAPSGTGGATAIIAAVVGMAGAIWYAVDAVRNWSAIQGLLTSLDSLPRMSMGGWDTVLAYGMVAATVAQLLLTPILLIGGLLLLTRNSAGRTMVVLGTALVLLANIFWAATAIRIHTMFGSYSEQSGEFIGRLMLNIGLPLLLAIVVLVLASTSSTKQWCRRTTPTY